MGTYGSASLVTNLSTAICLIGGGGRDLFGRIMLLLEKRQEANLLAATVHFYATISSLGDLSRSQQKTNANKSVSYLPFQDEQKKAGHRD